MDKKFPYFQYDLSQNLVHYVRKEFVPLHIQSLILTIASIYKDSHIIEAMKKTIDSLEDPQNLTNNDIIKIVKLQSIAKETFVLKLNGKYTRPFVDWFIHYVFMQILDFFIKGAMHNSIPLNVYLENLTFTSQGTINLKKTILRILQGSSLPLSSKFAVACHYFVDKYFIRNLYNSDKSEKEEKYFTANPKFITDYSLYYWMWQIHGTRKLVTEANSFYSKSGSMWSRAELPNEVAILIIFQKAIEDNNELAVQYLWTNHISKMTGKFEKLSNVLTVAFTDTTKINICLYLLFQIQNNEVKWLLKFISNEMMKCIIKNVRWYYLSINIFKEFVTFFSTDNILELLYMMSEDQCRYHSSRIAYSSIKDHVLTMPGEEKEILSGGRMKFVRTLLKFINNRRDLMAILLKSNLRKNKMLVCIKSGENFLTELIKKEEFHLLQSTGISFEGEDAHEIKLFMNFQKFYCISHKFIKSLKVLTLSIFIDWRTRASADQYQFKNEIIEMSKNKLKTFFKECKSISNHNSVNDLILFIFWSIGLKEYLSNLTISNQFRSGISFDEMF
ncbi:UNVERIFIED_CONTAM: hypothetical protein RMT77_011463 [Armadillidium vulgare]